MITIIRRLAFRRCFCLINNFVFRHTPSMYPISPASTGFRSPYPTSLPITSSSLPRLVGDRICQVHSNILISVIRYSLNSAFPYTTNSINGQFQFSISSQRRKKTLKFCRNWITKNCLTSNKLIMSWKFNYKSKEIYNLSPIFKNRSNLFFKSYIFLIIKFRIYYSKIIQYK